MHLRKLHITKVKFENSKLPGADKDTFNGSFLVSFKHDALAMPAAEEIAKLGSNGLVDIDVFFREGEQLSLALKASPDQTRASRLTANDVPPTIPIANVLPCEWLGDGGTTCATPAVSEVGPFYCAAHEAEWFAAAEAGMFPSDAWREAFAKVSAGESPWGRGPGLTPEAHPATVEEHANGTTISMGGDTKVTRLREGKPKRGTSKKASEALAKPDPIDVAIAKAKSTKPRAIHADEWQQEKADGPAPEGHPGGPRGQILANDDSNEAAAPAAEPVEA